MSGHKLKKEKEKEVKERLARYKKPLSKNLCFM